ncbi:unnamed protein product [Ectocarpus sp. 4 AP-2014]
MNAVVQFFAVVTPVLLTMQAAKKVRTWFSGKKGPGVELYIEGCLSVQGGRLAVYKEAEMWGARLITDSIKGAISSQDGGLLIKLGFQDDVAAGHFIGKVRTWCEFHDLTLRPPAFYEDVGLGNRVTAAHYVSTETASPPGALARSRSRSSEATFKTYVTEILDDKDEHCIYQSFEIDDRWNQKDSCQLLAHSECKGTPVDKDASNRVACSTRVHRGLDGTSDKFPPWIRIKIKNVDTEPVRCIGKNGKEHFRFRVNLLIDFHKEEQKRDHGICWKEGTKDDEEGPVETFVHVKNYDMFVSGVEWKCAHTTEIWDSIREVP